MNRAAHDDCKCEFCSSCCPYMTFLHLINRLKEKNVCPDVAARVAADFVLGQQMIPPLLVPSSVGVKVS